MPIFTRMWQRRGQNIAKYADMARKDMVSRGYSRGPGISVWRKTPVAPRLAAHYPASLTDLGSVDTQITSTAVSTTPIVTLVSGIAEGTAVNQHQGRKLHIKSIRWSGHVYADTAATVNTVRLSLIHDLAPNGALPDVSLIYDTVGGNYGPWSPLNINGMRRFRVLASRVLSIAGQSTTTAAQAVQPFDIYVKRNIDVQLLTGTAAITSIASGAIYAVLIGSSVSGTADCITDGNVRIRFVSN